MCGRSSSSWGCETILSRESDRVQILQICISQNKFKKQLNYLVLAIIWYFRNEWQWAWKCHDETVFSELFLIRQNALYFTWNYQLEQLLNTLHNMWYSHEASVSSVFGFNLCLMCHEVYYTEYRMKQEALLWLTGLLL